MTQFSEQTKAKRLTKIVDAIWEEDGEIQELALQEFSKSYRKCAWKILKEMKAFIAFHNNYISSFVDQDAFDYTLGLYNRQGICYFNTRLVIPIYGFDGLVHSFVGYDNGNECLTEDEKKNHVNYLYQFSEFFHKDRYLLSHPKTFKQALEEQRIFIVDGVFDMISLTND